MNSYIHVDQRPTLQALMEYLKEVRGSNWFIFGIALSLPVSKLRAIETNYAKEGMISSLHFSNDESGPADFGQTTFFLVYNYTYKSCNCIYVN